MSALALAEERGLTLKFLTLTATDGYLGGVLASSKSGTLLLVANRESEKSPLAFGRSLWKCKESSGRGG